MNGKQHFARALSDLRDRMGVGLADLTSDEIADLVHAADRCADPFRDVNADAVGRPVRVCEGVHFWRLTIGASVWLDDMSRMFGGDSDRYHMCLIHALVHAREPGAFEGLEDERSVLKAVKRTCRAIAATPEEVGLAIDEVLDLKIRRMRRDDIERSAADWCAICSRLEGQTGIPAHDWIWKHSAGYTVRCYNDLHAFASSFAGGKSEHMKDELDRANENLQALKVGIRKRVRSEK